MQWCINNIDNACQHIVNRNPDIGINTDASPGYGGITDTIHPSKGLWQKPKIGHINRSGLRAIRTGV